MKLGKETGSLINHLMGNSLQPDPFVGQGATFLSWTDRYPGTVVSWDGKRVGVQEDKYVRVDGNGMSESQEYTFTPNTEATIRYFQKNKNGDWKAVVFNEETKRWNKVSCGGLHIGHRERYYDFSF